MELVDLQAAVTSSRVLFEVEALEHALELVINRAGAIHEAQEKRRHKVLAITWNKEGLPRDLISDFRGPDLWERRQDYVALQEQQAHEQLSPEAQAQAIYADTPLFATSFMKQQLPFSSHKVSNALTVQPMQ